VEDSRATLRIQQDPELELESGIDKDEDKRMQLITLE
jgi:hypothetical protein